MKAQALNLMWTWLAINVVLTLFSMILHLLKSKTSKSQAILYTEDKMNFKLSALNALREVIEIFLGFSIVGFFVYNISGYWSASLSWTWLTFVGCLICVDFLYFMSHLAGHKVQFFWNYHSVHHNSEEYSLSTGFRVSWIKFVFDWIFYLPIVIVGFPPEMVLVSMALITSYTHLLHTKSVNRIPIFEYVFNTPRAHRIHHSSHELHIDKNMGGILMIWDLIWGTFSLKNHENVVYGLTRPLEKNNLFYINFSEWRQTYLVLKANGLNKTMVYLIRDPMKNKDILIDLFESSKNTHKESVLTSNFI